MRPLDYSPNFYREWVFPWENKLAVYIVLWSACYHRDMLRITLGPPGEEVDSRQQLHLHALSIKTLRQEINNIESVATPDALVMSILFLAVNVSHRTGFGREKSLFWPPFTGLHGLELYGSREYHPTHWGILHDIIRRFGGVSSIRVFGIAWLLSIADLMHAVNTLQKPIYPALGAPGQILNLDRPLTLFQVEGLGSPTSSRGIPAGLGFQALNALSPPIRDKVINVFVDVGEYSRVIQHYSGQACSPAVLDLLGDSRNLVHNRLFFLPDDNDDDLTQEVLESRDHTHYSTDQIALSRRIYLFCRLSTILYAIHVSYPIPRSKRLRMRILGELGPKYHTLIGRAPDALLLWALVIVIICSGDKAPGELLDCFASLCMKLKLDSRPKLLVLLQSFAWVECAVPDASPFWTLADNVVGRAKTLLVISSRTA
ncbi:hypothetical protein BJX65DRAFT_286127 [Aspergillus insuetus]